MNVRARITELLIGPRGASGIPFLDSIDYDVVGRDEKKWQKYCLFH